MKELENKLYDFLAYELESDEPFSYYDKLIIVGDNLVDLHIIPTFELKKAKPTSKEVALAVDIVKQQYPLWANANRTVLAGFVRDIFKYDGPIEQLIRTRPRRNVNLLTMRGNKPVKFKVPKRPSSRLKRNEIWLSKSRRKF